MLKKMFPLLIVFSMFVVSANAQTWKIDKNNSDVGFSVTHLVISKVKGNFRDFDAEVNFDGKNLDKASIKATVQTASINTGNDRRDDHLRSADFFDAEKYPTMTFVSKKIIPGEGNNFKMIGDLTMRGVTKETTFEGRLNGIIDDHRGHKRAGLTASTTINRQDFGVAWDNKLQDGSLVVSNDVDVELNIEMVEDNPAADQ